MAHRATEGAIATGQFCWTVWSAMRTTRGSESCSAAISALACSVGKLEEELQRLQ